MAVAVPLGAPATEDDIVNNPDFAFVREMLKRQGVPMETAVEDQNMQPSYETNAGGALSSLVPPAETSEAETSGALPAATLAAIQRKRTEFQDLAAQQKAYYENVARQLAERRTGPSTSERLFELSAALAAPTTVRGLSGVMGNVMPVLQRQAQQRREGEDRRAEALNALQQAQIASRQGLLGMEINSDLALAKLEAAKNKGVRLAFDSLGRARHPYTGAIIREAPAAAVMELRAAPDRAAAMKEFDATFGNGAALLYLGGE